MVPVAPVSHGHGFITRVSDAGRIASPADVLTAVCRDINKSLDISEVQCPCVACCGGSQVGQGSPEDSSCLISVHKHWISYIVFWTLTKTNNVRKTSQSMSNSALIWPQRQGKIYVPIIYNKLVTFRGEARNQIKIPGLLGPLSTAIITSSSPKN